MRVIKTSLLDVLILEPKVYEDERGFFLESWNENTLKKEANIHDHFVQDNHSRSKKGVLRGLHYQTQNSQGKLVRVGSGSVFDVAVDLRKSSKTFGNWVGVELSDDNQRQLWIPAGFAHGFLVLSESVDFFYKTTNYYSPQYESTIQWNDPVLEIDWPIIKEGFSLSEKDRKGVLFENADYFS